MISDLLAFEIEGKDYWFQTYTGISHYGCIIKHRESQKWYIVPKNRIPLGGIRNEQVVELGILVDLRGLYLRDDAPEEMETYDSRIEFNSPLKVILVLIGAGASYDVSGQKGFKLPMTKDLFSAEYQSDWEKFEGVNALYSDLVEIQNLELFFERQWKKLEANYNRELLAELINVQYYLQYFFLKKSIEGRQERLNYYTSLVRQMRDHPKPNEGGPKFVVVNFNYDTLFEDVLSSFLGYKFESLKDYDDFSRNIIVFKPHGSSNWCRYVKTEFQHEFERVKKGDRLFFPFHAANTYISKMDLAKFSRILENRISIMSEAITEYSEKRNMSNMFIDLGSDRSFLPHLLIPFKSKDEFVIPRSQADRLELLLRFVESMYIFGWKGGEAKFLEMLKRSLAQRPLEVHGFTTESGLKDIIENMSPYIEGGEFKNSSTIGFAKSMARVSGSEDGLFSGKLDFASFKN
jgi:hypothetical protein